MFRITAAFCIPGMIIPLLVTVAAAPIGPLTAEAVPAQVGTVNEVRSGALERRDGERWMALAAGSRLAAGDRVRTNAAGMAVLMLTGTGSVLVGPGTEYTLADATPRSRSLLHRGYLWFSAVLSPGRSLNIETTDAVSGVRGTKFSVMKDSKGTDVCTCKGEVEVKPKSGSAYQVKGGTYSVVGQNGKPQPVQSGKVLLERVWKTKDPEYAFCISCHKKDQKIRDLF